MFQTKTKQKLITLFFFFLSHNIFTLQYTYLLLHLPITTLLQLPSQAVCCMRDDTMKQNKSRKRESKETKRENVDI